MRLHVIFLLAAFQVASTQLTCEVTFVIIGHGISCKSAAEIDNVYSSRINEEAISNQTSTDPSKVVKANEIKHILMERCNIVDIDSDSIKDLARLEWIWLSNNKLTTLRDNTFAGGINVKDLFLDHNKISTIEENAFKPLQHLTKVLLFNNNIRELNINLFAFNTGLKHVVLRSNEFTELPEGLFRNNKELSDVDLSDNALSTLPPNIFEGLISLVTLNLNNCKFTTLPPAIQSLTHINYLYASDNEIETVPEGYFDGLKNLVDLDLSSNKISQVGDHTFSELHLRILDLSSNSIGDGKWISQLNNTWSLNLSHNDLKNVGIVFPEVLKRIAIRGNPLECKCFNETVDVLKKKNIKYDMESFNKPKYACIAVDESNSNCPSE